MSYHNPLNYEALMYNGINGGIVALRPDDEDDDLNQIAAGALTGAIFKATAGVRPFAVGTVFGGCVTAAYLVAKRGLQSAGIL